jgi:hypothetical protein
MRSKQKRKSHIRSFERDARVQRLVEAGIIKSADEIPDDAIPAGVEYIQRTRSSYSLHHRPPYYRDIEFRCQNCGRQNVWTADDQRHWYEQLRGSPYGTAKRCSECRRKRRGVQA